MSPSLMDLDWPRRTERLVLRPVAPTDLDRMWAYWGDVSVTRWLPASPSSPEALAERIFEPTRLASTLAVELGGVMIGDLMLRIGDAWAQDEIADDAVGRQAVIGYAFDPAVSGQGYASEANHALLGIAFDELGVHRVSADCFANNEPSWRLLERLGMRREQHLVKDSLHRHLGWCDSYGYAMLEEEWAASSA